MKTEEARARADILKALAHPVRLKIVDQLSRGDKCGCELLPVSGVDQSVLSRHVAQLKHAGIVTERRDGVRVFYHLACPCILQALECTMGVMKADTRRRTKLLGSRV